MIWVPSHAETVELVELNTTSISAAGASPPRSMFTYWVPQRTLSYRLNASPPAPGSATRVPALTGAVGGWLLIVGPRTDQVVPLLVADRTSTGMPVLVVRRVRQRM